MPFLMVSLMAMIGLYRAGEGGPSLSGRLTEQN
jgi:hypothetical protein